MRIAIFIDGANLYYTQRRNLHWNIDLEKFRKYFAIYGEVVDAYYYTGIVSEPTAGQKKFLECLPSIGYSVITKPVKAVGTGHKANLDVEIVLDMFTTINSYDVAVLVSGDSDFERALVNLRVLGKGFFVVSTAGTVARELRNACGMHYIDLADIREYVELDRGSAPQDILPESYWDDFPPEAENE